MAYYIYILESEKDGCYYIGHSDNVKTRLHRHNQGRSSYTKAKKPWKLIYQEEFSSRVKRQSVNKKSKRKRIELTSSSS